MAYIEEYTVAITYRWKPAYSYVNKTQTTCITVSAPDQLTAVGRAMGELNTGTEVYVTEVEITGRSGGYYDYE